MKTIKGPAIFLAQFVRDEAPFNNLDGITTWVADLGYKGIQIPAWDARLIDLNLAATSKTYCDELRGKVESKGLLLVELAAYLTGTGNCNSPCLRNHVRCFLSQGIDSKSQDRMGNRSTDDDH